MYCLRKLAFRTRAVADITTHQARVVQDSRWRTCTDLSWWAAAVNVGVSEGLPPQPDELPGLDFGLPFRYGLALPPGFRNGRESSPATDVPHRPPGSTEYPACIR